MTSHASWVKDSFIPQAISLTQQAFPISLSLPFYTETLNATHGTFFSSVPLHFSIFALSYHSTCYLMHHFTLLGLHEILININR